MPGFPTAPLVAGELLYEASFDKFQEHFADPTQHVRTIPGFATGNTAAANRSALASALQGSNNTYVVPAGDNLFENSPMLSITNFTGALIFRPGARLRCAANTTHIIRFDSGCHGMQLIGFNADFVTLPTVRGGGEGLDIRASDDVVLENISIRGSRGAGIILVECQRPRLSGVRVRDTMADGLHVANCRDAVIYGVFTDNTGDDGLAFLNYNFFADYNGAHASHSHVRNSNLARGIGARDAQDALIRQNTFWNNSGGAIRASDSGRTDRPNLLNIDIVNNTLNGE